MADRPGWPAWTRADRWSSHPLRLTPDAVATLLLLTTTATRAASFVRAVGQVLGRHRADGNDRAAMLVVAACGFLREPARAVAGPCWSHPWLCRAAAKLAAGRLAEADEITALDGPQSSREIVEDLTAALAEFETVAPALEEGRV